MCNLYLLPKKTGVWLVKIYHVIMILHYCKCWQHYKCHQCHNLAVIWCDPHTGICQNFCTCQRWSLGFLCKTQHFATFLLGFFTWFFKCGIQPFATGFATVKNYLFCSCEHRKQKIAGLIPGFHWQFNGDNYLMQQPYCLTDISFTDY